MAVDHQDAPPRIYHPRWPDRTAIDPERLRISYWQEVDTLMVDFAGTNPPAISIPLDLDPEHDYFYLRLDPLTEDVVGLQIEDFTDHAIHRHPSLLDLLDLATLHGVTRGELEHLRQSVDASARKRAAVAAIFDELTPLTA